MRHVVINYHIFKNAGTTIDSILSNNFGPLHGHLENKNPWDTLEPDQLLAFVEANPALTAVSTHHGRLPVPVHPDVSFYPLVFLRHPIDRVGSVYSFERRQPKDSPGLGVKVARENDLKGYVKWRLADGNGAVIRNFHTVHLAGRERDMRYATATAEDYHQAAERLFSLPFFGIVEAFTDSIDKMGSYLGKIFGPLDMSCSIQNRSDDREEILEERLAVIETSLGPHLFQELMEKNRMDMELYDFAHTLFRSRSNTSTKHA